MKKLLSIAAATAVALAFSFAAATPSSADPASDAIGAGIVGGMFGFMAGTAAAGGLDSPHHSHHWSKWKWEQHVQDCEDYWGWRYDPGTDLVTQHHHQFYCDL